MPAPESVQHPLRLITLLQESGLPYDSTDALNDIMVTGITEDSRQVTPGMVFVARDGTRQNGRSFVDQAISAGAVAVIACAGTQSPRAVPTIEAEDPPALLARLLARFAGLTEVLHSGALHLVGITGTNGKSTTVHLLHEILRRANVPSAMLGTIGYDLVGEFAPAPWTTPPADELSRLLMRAHGHGARCAAMEVSSHALAQRRTDGLRFSTAVFTNLTGDHLDYHENRAAYAGAKQRLFNGLDSDAWAVVNADDPASAEMTSRCAARRLSFALDTSADYAARELTCDIHGARFRIEAAGQHHVVHLPLVGRHNVANALAAAAAARTLEVPWDVIIAGLQSSSPIAGRLQPAQPPGHPFSVFVDYAHTDDALDNVLSSLRPLTSGKLWCVFGCGGDRDRSKRPRMAAVSARYADEIVVTSDNPRTEPPGTIVDDILTGFDSPRRRTVQVEVDRARAIELALRHARPNDVVLIAGKGHEDYQLIGDRRLHFDDREVVQQVLSPTECID
jgi:UDP-N-acetylmuramoyl-L-alanyl-D-glutamate--2,6-diaminopimelate ligase